MKRLLAILSAIALLALLMSSCYSPKQLRCGTETELTNNTSSTENSTTNPSITVEKFEFKKEYLASLEAWKKAKAEKGNSYRYTCTFESVEGMFSSQCIITVENGKVTKREYKGYKNLGFAGKPDYHWVETGDEIGTHTGADKARTLDEVYEDCKEPLSLDIKDHYIYFEAKHDGLLSLCGNFPRNCADDCFEGVDIQKIEWLN